MKKIILFISASIILSMQSLANDCINIMSKEVEEQVIGHLQNKNSDLKKLNTIKTYLARICIDTRQMNSIISIFDNIEFKKEFYIYAKDYIIDIENYEKNAIK